MKKAPRWVRYAHTPRLSERINPSFSQFVLTQEQPAQTQRDKPQRRHDQRGAYRLPASVIPARTQRTPYRPSTSAYRAASYRWIFHAGGDAFCGTRYEHRMMVQTNINRMAETVVIMVNAPITLGLTISITTPPSRQIQEKVRPFAGTARFDSLANAFGATPSCAGQTAYGWSRRRRCWRKTPPRSAQQS